MTGTLGKASDFPEDNERGDELVLPNLKEQGDPSSYLSYKSVTHSMELIKPKTYKPHQEYRFSTVLAICFQTSPCTLLFLSLSNLKQAQ